MIKKLLVAIDASDAAASAVTAAEQLAKQVGAQMVILHVIDVLTCATRADGIHRFQPTFEELRRDGDILLRDTRARLAPELAVKLVLSDGPAAEVILSEAARHDVDLIVLGTDSRGRLSHFLLGSTADAVIRRAERPVLSVRCDMKCSRETDEQCHVSALA
jgi:nucleotide-binding universal stress UspA family protein